ncbi:MAG: D-aminoacylase [Burkholderiaceae bacterium]
MAEFDILIRQGRVIDGTGGPSQTLDIGVRGDRIVAMGDLHGDRAGQVVDADGLVVAPGFIDAHCHDDREILTQPLIPAKVNQGVTTVINGNCGISLAPLPGLADGLSELPDPLPLMASSVSAFHPTVADYFRALEDAPAAVNSALLCGHSTLRTAIMSGTVSRPATAGEITAMQNLLDRAMRDGALGISTGTFYPAGREAPTTELSQLTRVVAPYAGVYVTHMRDENDHVDDSLRETFAIGREAGVPVIVSHHKCGGKANHGRSVETLALIEAARQNQPVGLDVYPYTAGSTVFIEPLILSSNRVMIASSKPRPDTVGRWLDEVAAEMGCDLLAAARALSPGAAVYFVLDEQDVQRILAFEHSMVGSDGVHSERPHPRAWGTFPRVLGHYSRDLGLFSLETAVYKMTGLTAARFGLVDRGVLREGVCGSGPVRPGHRGRHRHL